MDESSRIRLCSLLVQSRLPLFNPSQTSNVTNTQINLYIVIRSCLFRSSEKGPFGVSGSSPPFRVESKALSSTWSLVTLFPLCPTSPSVSPTLFLLPPPRSVSPTLFLLPPPLKNQNLRGLFSSEFVLMFESICVVFFFVFDRGWVFCAVKR
jgi:hypothetical protein